MMAMTMETFKGEVLSELEKMVGNGTQIIEQEVLKTNGIRKHGISLMQNGESICPVFYWEDLPEQEMEEQDVRGVAEILYSVLHPADLAFHQWHRDMFLNWELAKEHLRFRVINYEKNAELLKGLPHRKCLDLAAVVYLEIQNGEETGTSLVRYDLMELWQVSETELMKQTWENMGKLPCRHDGLADMMRSLLQMELDEEGCDPDIMASMEKELGLDRTGEPEMYVVQVGNSLTGSNPFGAAAILNPDNFKFLEKDCWILPSSLHELIVLPYEDGMDGNLKEMVRSVNCSDVQESDRLSDHIYRYHYDSNTLELI
ncbi:MAG: DUF5688 family protein [Dorea sp.]